MTSKPRIAAAVTLTLQHAARAWRFIADEALARYGVSHATAYPLVHIDRLGDGVRQGALADFMGIEGPSLVRLLDQLCEAGLVERREDSTDRRAKTLHLTAEGRALVTRIDRVLNALREKLFTGISVADLETCLRVLGSIRTAYGRPGPEPGACR
jgi:MarR family transcriptional regulator for hemolysin